VKLPLIIQRGGGNHTLSGSYVVSTLGTYDIVVAIDDQDGMPVTLDPSNSSLGLVGGLLNSSVIRPCGAADVRPGHGSGVPQTVASFKPLTDRKFDFCRQNWFYEEELMLQGGKDFAGTYGPPGRKQGVDAWDRAH